MTWLGLKSNAQLSTKFLSLHTLQKSITNSYKLTSHISQTSCGLSVVKEHYQVSNHFSHSGISSSNTVRMLVIMPIQANITFPYPKTWQTTSLYLLLVLLDPSFFLKERVVLSWWLLVMAMVKWPSIYLNKSSSFHALEIFSCTRTGHLQMLSHESNSLRVHCVASNIVTSYFSSTTSGLTYQPTIFPELSSI